MPPNQLPAAGRFQFALLDTGYLTFRRAWLDGATEGELTDLATECRRGPPSPAPPTPAAMFIHRDIVITAPGAIGH